MLIENADYFIRLVHFPVTTIDGAVRSNKDGTFMIYLSADQDEAHRRKALEHELEHIERDHFYIEAPVEQQEAEANHVAAPSVEEPKKEKDWFSSWQDCMAWCRKMAETYGCPDDPNMVPDFKAS